MQVTDVRIKLLNSGNLKAVATVVIDDAIAIHSLKIIDGKKGVFLGFPSQKVGEEFKDIVHPISTDARNIIQSKVLAAYYDELNKPEVTK